MLDVRTDEIKTKPIKSFTDLMAWQAAYKLCLETYKTTKSFSSSENIGLTSQMRRASVSAVSNIAEGFGRSSKKDRGYFYQMASGSLYELKSQMLVASGLQYLSESEYAQLLELADRTHKLLHGLLRAHRASNINHLTSKRGFRGEDIQK